MTDDETYDAVLDGVRAKADVLRRVRDETDDGVVVRISVDALPDVTVLDDGSLVRLTEELAIDGIEIVWQ